jgi:hypothetical protein
VRAASFATGLIVVVCTLEFLAMALALRDGKPLLVALVMVPLMVLAIWMIAAVMATVSLLAKWLWVRWRYSVHQPPRWTTAGSGVWDLWLDGPALA